MTSPAPHYEPESERRVVCECCERRQQADEEGWTVHLVEGVDFCPECANALKDESGLGRFDMHGEYDDD